MPLSLQSAKLVIDGALEKARVLGLQPLTVAVLDTGGHLVALERQDGASILRPEIAVGKAAGALALGVNSRQIAKMSEERPGFVAALQALAPKGLVPAAGGVLALDDAGVVLGAVGVTGDASDQDEACALAGLAAASLSTRA